MLAWSVEALAAAESVGPIVVAAPPGFTEQVGEAVEASVEVVGGGETRAESVRAALERVATHLVVIHDAARPLVTSELVEGVLGTLVSRPEVDGVIAAAPIADTVKRARDLEISGTEDREALWGAQTPQAFRVAKLREAYEAGGGDVAGATDEAMLVEGAGGTVLIAAAPAWNLKVTTPEDLRVADLILRER